MSDRALRRDQALGFESAITNMVCVDCIRWGKDVSDAAHTYSSNRDWFANGLPLAPHLTVSIRT